MCVLQLDRLSIRVKTTQSRTAERQLTIPQRRSDAEFLPPDDSDVELSKREHASGRTKSPWATLSVLILGCFISNADSSLVLATYGKISSEFGDLDSGSWLLSSYILAMSAVQPLVGKLSDIYGRKPILLLAYTL